MLPESRIQDDPYQIPKFDLNRADIMDFIAHFFLWHIKLRLGEKSTSNYAVAA